MYHFLRFPGYHFYMGIGKGQEKKIKNNQPVSVCITLPCVPISEVELLTQCCRTDLSEMLKRVSTHLVQKMLVTCFV